MDVTFFKDTTYFTKNTLQGENNSKEEDHFWKTASVLPLPLPIESNIIDYISGGETLRNKHQFELLVYSRRNKS